MCCSRDADSCNCVQYLEDSALRDVLRRYMPVDTLAQVSPDLGTLWTSTGFIIACLGL